ncbi:hypothetical protein [Flaviaesturariibacter amylovorans]|uniref:Methyltransferase domain-containing protein n=1 Tax=Flaviaesturariibacter amylovorans TaxID=1084520 RepID=A0ABP8GFU6_9BACT
MDPLPLLPCTIELEGSSLTFLVPDAAAVQERYLAAQAAGDAPPFPYWTKLWPSAKVLAAFVLRHPGFFAGKRVLELAAGLGLPALAAARYAAHVTCSEYLPEALEVLSATFARYPELPVEIRMIDWNHLPGDLDAEVVLLSDVNYAPGDFPALLDALQRLLAQGALLLLATPQRLAGRDFLSALQPWVRHQELHTAPDGADIQLLVLSADKEVLDGFEGF